MGIGLDVERACSRGDEGFRCDDDDDCAEESAVEGLDELTRTAGEEGRASIVECRFENVRESCDFNDEGVPVRGGWSYGFGSCELGRLSTRSRGDLRTPDTLATGSGVIGFSDGCCATPLSSIGKVPL